MPNECINHLTIVSKSESDIIEIIESDIKMIQANVDKQTKKGIRFHFKTAWKPDYLWLESLNKKYPNSWIKNEWISEDGEAGVWIGHQANVKSMEWQDLSLEDDYYHFNLV
jgi:hypothetical protein